jgi:hypothetical protein
MDDTTATTTNVNSLGDDGVETTRADGCRLPQAAAEGEDWMFFLSEAEEEGLSFRTLAVTLLSDKQQADI